MIVGLHHDCHHPVHVRFRSQERMNLEICSIGIEQLSVPILTRHFTAVHQLIFNVCVVPDICIYFYLAFLYPIALTVTAIFNKETIIIITTTTVVEM